MISICVFLIVLVPSVIHAQEVPAGCPLMCPLDLQIIQDISCSIETVNKFQVQDFLIKFAEEIGPCIGHGNMQTQMGLISYDKKTYHNFYLNRYSSGTAIAQAIQDMDWNHQNIGKGKKGSRCGTATYKALNEARLVALTEAHGIRDPLGIKSPPIKKVVIVLTDGATHPPEKSTATITAARQLKKGSGATTIALELPNNKMNNDPALQARGTKEFREIASSEDAHFRVTNFDNLINRMEEVLDSLCDPTPTILPEDPEEPVDPCEKFSSFNRECEITMAMCNPADPRCCGCPMMFKDPVTKSDKTPFEVAYNQGMCLCEDCIRRSYFCLPKALRPILSKGKPKVSRYYPGAPPDDADNTP
ncbi:unnamed protein product [Owenia fusiformis]|uniref:Uncharacterized protein n=1 Tax=Owenia fusiformis TaxID=6347 RepID=A0A8J1TRM8_OWEFU|nr:unnamed protein product [Owenia fusiformis]